MCIDVYRSMGPFSLLKIQPTLLFEWYVGKMTYMKDKEVFLNQVKTKLKA